jgi:hypothetical protein
MSTQPATRLFAIHAELTLPALRRDFLDCYSIIIN